MEIREVIEALEGTVISDLARMTPKERVTLYASLKEFEQAKLQRATAAPIGDLDTQFSVKIYTEAPDGN